MARTSVALARRSIKLATDTLSRWRGPRIWHFLGRLGGGGGHAAIVREAVSLQRRATSYVASSRTLDFGTVSHPSLGLPPRDLQAGHPADAASIRTAASRLAARSLERAIDADPEFRPRYSDLALRELLADTEALADSLATAVASDDPLVLGSLAEHLAPRYRKRQVPLDDVIALCEGLRTGARTVITPGAGASVDAAVDAAIAALKWHRRLAGDARKHNAFIAFIYKGA